jgi:hypothetical protein
MDVVETFLSIIQDGGGKAGWALAGYLLWRLHQVTDRQYRHAVETAAVLSVIKTLLMTRARMVEWGGDDAS